VNVDNYLPRSWLGFIGLVSVAVFFGGALAYSVGEWNDSPPSSSSADVGFLQDMISHHEQALALSLTEIDDGASPEARLFAKEILQQQSWEIGLMQRQLEQWGHRRETRPATAMEWMGMAVEVDEMPGLASDAELDALRDAEGEGVDALFLALMEDHHRGGVEMAEAAAERASDPWVRDLAERMARNQSIEINEMELARRRAGLADDPEGYVAGPFGGHGATEEPDGDGDMEDMEHSGG
jgi:uncharacterized protein (DUF305 family)